MQAPHPESPQEHHQMPGLKGTRRVTFHSSIQCPHCVCPVGYRVGLCSHFATGVYFGKAKITKTKQKQSKKPCRLPYKSLTVISNSRWMRLWKVTTFVIRGTKIGKCACQKISQVKHTSTMVCFEAYSLQAGKTQECLMSVEPKCRCWHKDPQRSWHRWEGPWGQGLSADRGCSWKPLSTPIGLGSPRSLGQQPREWVKSEETREALFHVAGVSVHPQAMACWED